MKLGGKPLQLPNSAGGDGEVFQARRTASAKELGISLGCLPGPGKDFLEGAQQKTDLLVLCLVGARSSVNTGKEGNSSKKVSIMGEALPAGIIAQRKVGKLKESVMSSYLQIVPCSRSLWCVLMAGWR